MTAVRSLQLSHRWGMDCWFNPRSPLLDTYPVRRRVDGERIGAAVTVLRFTVVLRWRASRPRSPRVTTRAPIRPRRRIRDWADSAWDSIESLWD
ncbi:hypothetical protein ACIQ9R_36085 [Streptomyces sp. NPDC094447]|uniref:hypothetical protein n=1 Tax=Streptomyces sp. NPDC094447 TaxID=3366062 RepID=UPI00382D6EF8